MELYKYNWKNNLKKMDRQEACIYKATLYELKESTMLENLINSQGKSPLLQSNGRYINIAGTTYSFYEQYKMIKNAIFSNYFIVCDKPFNDLCGIEIASKNRLPIVIDRKISYRENVITDRMLRPVSVIILNEKELAPLVFVIEASPVYADDIEFENMYDCNADLLIKKYSTNKIVQSLESQKCCYDEVREYLYYTSHRSLNIEELQQRKQKELEKAYQEYQIYLQNHEQEELEQAEKIERERVELKKIVRRLRETN